MSKFNVLETQYTDLKTEEVANGAMLCVNSRMQFDFLMDQGIAAMIPGFVPLIFMLINREHKVSLSGVIVVESSGSDDVDCRTVIKAFEDKLDDKLTELIIAVPTYGSKTVRSLEGDLMVLLASYTFAYMDGSNYYEGTFDTKASLGVDYTPNDKNVNVLAYDLQYSREALCAGEVFEQRSPIPIGDLCDSFKTAFDVFVFDSSVDKLKADAIARAVVVDSPDTLQ